MLRLGRFHVKPPFEVVVTTTIDAVALACSARVEKRVRNALGTTGRTTGAGVSLGRWASPGDSCGG